MVFSVLAGLVLWFVLTWLLYRKHILTRQLYLVIVIVSGLFLLNLLLIVPLSLLPMTLWPPLKPEMTWAEIVHYLLTPTGAGKMVGQDPGNIPDKAAGVLVEPDHSCLGGFTCTAPGLGL